MAKRVKKHPTSATAAKAEPETHPDLRPKLERAVERSVLDKAELLSIIFKYLKEANMAEQPLPFPCGWPKVKTHAFTQLATVNRAFFQCSVDIIWESMDSLGPFFAHLLQADKDEESRILLPLRYEHKGVTPLEWGRFTFYATKTKNLVLEHPGSTIMDAGWLSYIMNSPGRPSVLFPSLHHLGVKATDPLSLFVASNAVQGIQAFDLDVADIMTAEGVTRAKALTKGLSQNAVVLTHLRLTRPTMSSIVDNISRIDSLENLHLSIDHCPEDLELSKLTRLPSLKALHIVQNLDPLNQTIAAKFPLIVDCPPHRSHGPQLATLKTLSVKANGAAQYLIASALLPENLESVCMEVLPDILNTQMVLVPAIVSLYAHQNPALTSLQVSIPGSTPCVAEHQALAPFRNDARYDHVDRFLVGLSQLRNLKSLVIHSPFLSTPDISIGLWKASQLLSKLETLILVPSLLSNLPGEAPSLLPLRILEEISTYHPHLVELVICADLTDIPSPPLSRLSKVAKHDLHNIGIPLPAQFRVEELTLKQKFNLAHYLDTLFPRVTTGIWPKGTREEDFWGFIQESLDFYRMGRSQ